MTAESDTGRDALPRTVAVAEQGIERNIHRGMQIFVARGDEVIADFGIGEAQPGVPMTSDSLTLWLSSGKPLTAVAVAQQVEQGRAGFDDPVARHIPEFAAAGKEQITLAHLLTHDAGLRDIDIDWTLASWDDVIAAICEAPLRDGAVPGEAAAYDPRWSWFILGEVLRRLSGQSFAEHLEEAILAPLEMRETSNGMTDAEAEQAAQQDRLAWMYQRAGRDMQPLPWHEPRWLTASSPGSNSRGPARELGRFYQELLRCLRGAGRLLSQDMARTITSRQRADQRDATFQHVIDFGYGFLIDSNHHGVETVPYGFGRYCSPETFGHGGAQSSIGFADPRHELVVVAIANGMPGEPQHQRRSRAINEAIYVDLGLGE